MSPVSWVLQGQMLYQAGFSISNTTNQLLVEKRKMIGQHSSSLQNQWEAWDIWLNTEARTKGSGTKEQSQGHATEYYPVWLPSASRPPVTNDHCCPLTLLKGDLHTWGLASPSPVPSLGWRPMPRPRGRGSRTAFQEQGCGFLDLSRVRAHSPGTERFSRVQDTVGLEGHLVSPAGPRLESQPHSPRRRGDLHFPAEDNSGERYWPETLGWRIPTLKR